MAARGEKKNVTIYDIASQLGVGKTTVSLVLSGRGNISPRTRAVVLEKAREIGFQPNLHAQRLSNGRCEQSIFLFIENLYPGTGIQRADLIQRQLQQHGFDVPVYTYGSVLPHGDAAELLATLCRQRPRAIVYHGEYGPTAIETLAQYREMGGTVVCYAAKPVPTFDTVAFDYADAAYQAVHHLHRLGHRNIGIFNPGGDPRYVTGFEKVSINLGLEFSPETIFDGPSQEEGGLALAEQFLALRHRPTGLCLVNDATASVFVNQIMRAGLRVPGDVSIVSFDDTVQARTCIVPLTTMRQPIDEIACAVTKMCLSPVETNRVDARQVVIRSRLIERESTALLHS